MEWRRADGDSVTKHVRKLVDGSVGGVDEVGERESVRSSSGVSVKLVEALADVRGVDGFQNLSESWESGALARARVRS